MRLSLEKSVVADLGSADVIVVGGGAAGLCTAVQLARAGKEVILLEAGPPKPDNESQSFFRSATASGHPLPGLHIGRFRCLGGTTNFWGGQLVPFSEAVFSHREWIRSGQWPIPFSEVSAYYKRVYDLLGLNGVIQDDAVVWSKLGISPPPQSHYIKPLFTRWTRESNLAVFFDQFIRLAPNLQVVVDAQVAALMVNEIGNVTGVEIRRRGGRPVYVHAPHVVLANGTIEIARLLQLPASGGRPTPWSDNPWLGKGFIDHLDCFAGIVQPMDQQRFSDFFDNAFLNGCKYAPKLRLSDAAQVEEKMLDIAAHFVFKSSASEHLDNLKILTKALLAKRWDKVSLTGIASSLGAIRFLAPMAVRYLRYRRMTNFADRGILLRLTSEQSPNSESCIKIRSEHDSFGMNLVDVNWRIDPSDIVSISKFAIYIKEYLEEAQIAKVTLNRELTRGSPDFVNQIDDANHHMGGARMGKSSSDGVVDSNCKVFGTNGLYVAGAAIFPVSGFANPTLTAMALSLRLADHLYEVIDGSDVARPA